MTWPGEKQRHTLSARGITSSVVQSKTTPPRNQFFVPSKKIVSNKEIGAELERRILQEFRTAYKIPNKSYIIVELYDETWDSITNQYRQTFVFYLYDKQDKIITDGNGSFRTINTEVTPNKTYPSILDFKGTLVDVSFDIGDD